MKTTTILFTALILSASLSNAFSGTGRGGTCFSYACKIVLDEPTTEEAIIVLAGESTISENLRNAIEQQRVLAAQKIGVVKALNLSDSELLRFIISK